MIRKPASKSSCCQRHGAFFCFCVIYKLVTDKLCHNLNVWPLLAMKWLHKPIIPHSGGKADELLERGGAAYQNHPSSLTTHLPSQIWINKATEATISQIELKEENSCHHGFTKVRACNPRD